MFWIHGGKFSGGQNAMYTGFKYMEHDVVVVSVQYRLNVLGKLWLLTTQLEISMDVRNNAFLMQKRPSFCVRTVWLVLLANAFS